MKKIFLGQLIVIFNVAFCPLAGYSQNLLNIDDFGKYTKLVIQYRADKRLKDVPAVLKQMQRSDVIPELIASAAKYASVGGIEGAPYVSLIETAQNVDVAIYKQEFLKFSLKWIENGEYEILLKCGILHMHDLRFADLALGDELLTKFVGSSDERMQKTLSLILSKHRYRIYIVEEIRRLSSLGHNDHYIYLLESIRAKYLNSDSIDERTAEEVVDKCNRALDHVRKLKN